MVSVAVEILTGFNTSYKLLNLRAMSLNKYDLEYIKSTIEWLNEHTVLVDNNRTNCEIQCNSILNSLDVIDCALAELSNENINCNIPLVIKSVCNHPIEYQHKEIDGYESCRLCGERI